MKYFDTKFLKDVEKRGAVLLLDFDGVLSPIVRNSDRAGMSQKTRKALVECAKVMPVAIISGRSVQDVSKKVRITGIQYVGSHGMEWKRGRNIKRRYLSPRKMAGFNAARKKLLTLATGFKGLVITHKHCNADINYRALSDMGERRFRREAHALMEPFVREGDIRVIDNIKTFEVMPAHAWSKGESSLNVYNFITKRKSTLPIPIYIGDGITDEYAFKALSRGITIRVGKNSTSAAHFYFKSRNEVDRFLTHLAMIVHKAA